MASGGQRGERIVRVEVPCSTEGCGNTIRMTENRAKWATRYRVFCPSCREEKGIVGGGKPSNGRWIKCANPSCPNPDDLTYKRPSDLGTTCSRSCAAKIRADRGSNPITLRRLPDKECPICNTVFRPATMAQIYDKTECRDLAQRTIDRTPRLCEGCNKLYVPQYHGQRFHSQECRRNRITKSCEVCGQEFSGTPSKIGNQRWCPEHRQILYQMRNALLDQPWHNGKPKVKVKSKSANTIRWYIQIWQPDHPNSYVTGWMAEHVWVLCQRDGLDRIPDGFHVHHEDENGLNNEPTNLVLMSHGEHGAHTARENAKRAEAYRVLVAKLKAAGIDPETLEGLG